jgi:hypothetical protein
MIKVHYWRYGYPQEPKEFETLGEAADFAYKGSIESTVYVEWAKRLPAGDIFRRHELLEMGEKRMRDGNG